MLDEELREASGALTELNTILNSTQTKLNRLKVNENLFELSKKHLLDTFTFILFFHIKHYITHRFKLYNNNFGNYLYT